MKYAETVSEMLNAFQPRALDGEELKLYYCDNTILVRTGNPGNSPIRRIREACQMPRENNTFLLGGHRGCGKSTELNEMSRELRDNDFHVEIIPCGQLLDTYQLVYSDLLILTGDALLRIAGELGCQINERLDKTLKEFWTEKEFTTTLLDDSELSAQAGITAKTPSVIQNLLKFSFTAKSSLKFEEERRTIIRKRVTNRLSEWTRAMNELSDLITEKLEGKQPILIFEDLDKIDAEEAWKVFGERGSVMSAFTFPVIYTFPIALAYVPKFNTLRDRYNVEQFPMIKVEKLQGGRCDEGFATIRSIVEKRADLNLFETNVLDLAIEKTGGSLRDLFGVILDAATSANWRGSGSVSMEDIQLALQNLKSVLTRTIEEDDYDFLAKIVHGYRQKIKEREKLLEMLQGGIVLEYNGVRWHNVHPLVTDFLREQGLLTDEG